MLTSVLQDPLLHNPLACQEGTRDNLVFFFFSRLSGSTESYLADAKVGPLFYADDILMACLLSPGLASGCKCSLG